MIKKYLFFFFKIPISVAIFIWLSIPITKKVAIPYPIDISNPDIAQDFSNLDSHMNNVANLVIPWNWKSRGIEALNLI